MENILIKPPVTPPTPAFIDFQIAAILLADIARSATSFNDLSDVITGFEFPSIHDDDESKRPPTVRALLRELTQGYRVALKGPDELDMSDEFTRFKAAADLLAEANHGAVDYKDFCIVLENAFGHPLYDENRVDYAMALSQALTDGIERALE